jgi:hypothetical protein
MAVAEETEDAGAPFLVGATVGPREREAPQVTSNWPRL